MSNGLLRRITPAALAVQIALAPIAAVAQSDAEAQCRFVISKSVNRYVGGVLRTIGRCHRGHGAGRLPLSIDCNDVAQADPAGKLVRRRAHLVTAISGPASPCHHAPAVLLRYGRCPSSTSQGVDGATSEAIDSYLKLGECLARLIDGMGARGVAESMLPTVEGAAPLIDGCQPALAANVSKLTSACGRKLERPGQPRPPQ